jgi:hypothetical protein
MAHFAEINKNNKVLRVIVVNDKDTQDEQGNEVEAIGQKYLNDWLGGTWLKTSYNTRDNEHLKGGTPFRKNYAGIGYTFDDNLQGFIPPKRHDSFVLNEETCQWEPPIPIPDDCSSKIEGGKDYKWDEFNRAWLEIK